MLRDIAATWRPRVLPPLPLSVQVSLKDVELHNSHLADIIAHEYYRLYPFICRALANFVKDQVNILFMVEFLQSLKKNLLLNIFVL